MYLVPNNSKISNNFLPDNPLLLMNKFIKIINVNDNSKLEILKIDKAKTEIFRSLKSDIILRNMKKLFSEINKKMKIIAKSYSLFTSSRLIVGLGSTSVLETSIKLHHIYGVPYIPSTAIKGLLRAYKLWKLADWDMELFSAFEYAIKLVYEKCKEPEKEFCERLNNIQKKELKPEANILLDKTEMIFKKKNELFEILQIFGSQVNRGSLIVFDAYPEQLNGFEIDIMNPHYPDYYQDNQPPADWQNPNPVKFLVLPAGTRFNFYFLNPYEQLESDLKNALQLLGIGAKTALGYGVFQS
ncbi:type III-B CRISPR module RAMP protein Cmr6 [Thermodesulfobacterium thermophilum]|uniref:type III-B CRISPR module RAMP protein Cmr6 n=1 Tax=Thermodesulfobacterium thermophilum TaxID=886 RepID=UPI0003B6A4E9|nr:type III-B CRISPR module RAMP protein Cmr6 [Thermodesulfobacterium thermophilum]